VLWPLGRRSSENNPGDALQIQLAKQPVIVAGVGLSALVSSVEAGRWATLGLADRAMVFDLMDAVYPLELLTQTMHLAMLRGPRHSSAIVDGA